jgi:hypothetical protein
MSHRPIVYGTADMPVSFSDVALGVEADITQMSANVRLWPVSDVQSKNCCAAKCLLKAIPPVAIFAVK